MGRVAMGGRLKGRGRWMVVNGGVWSCRLDSWRRWCSHFTSARDLNSSDRQLSGSPLDWHEDPTRVA